MTTIRKAACAALLCLTAGTASGQTTQPTAEAERDLMLCLAAIQPLFDDKISDAMSIARVLSRYCDSEYKKAFRWLSISNGLSDPNPFDLRETWIRLNTRDFKIDGALEVVLRSRVKDRQLPR